MDDLKKSKCTNKILEPVTILTNGLKIISGNFTDSTTSKMFGTMRELTSRKNKCAASDIS